MVGKITFTSRFIQQLDYLQQALYQEKYFSSIENVDVYIDKIYDYIEENIEKPTVRKNNQAKFKKHGKKYLKYKANQRTTWYIFFDDKDGKFLVNYIINNHSHTFSELL
ncbi:hypothetical protein [Frigoriflavimonas asaccharolytica]|uniref:Uncharacterized protein n=1 Tax=Frigoriflavimonas asaccharolytica TaxID=2735899 RepID=A0A8J8G8A2_9FLAO|nr:hypothetical protein [Frigoriflavimonas asaccharolytica]NRS92796.1 hypothetical protein [Frigoriflavimonas asaccharolytica]